MAYSIFKGKSLSCLRLKFSLMCHAHFRNFVIKSCTSGETTTCDQRHLLLLQLYNFWQLLAAEYLSCIIQLLVLHEGGECCCSKKHYEPDSLTQNHITLLANASHSDGGSAVGVITDSSMANVYTCSSILFLIRFLKLSWYFLFI